MFKFGHKISLKVLHGIPCFMEYRSLGKTGFTVSVIGLGTEHLRNRSVEEITRIFRLALSEGINYIDLVWSYPNILEGLHHALTQEPCKPMIAFHLGSCVSNGKYTRSRNPAECEHHLRTLLDLFHQDSTPMLNIHYVLNLKVWQEITRKGILVLAEAFKEQNLVHAISVSTHDPAVVKVAAEAGVDSVMYQVNIANHQYPARNNALRMCGTLGVGVVAMKPFAGGALLHAGRKVRIPTYKTGWKTITMDVPMEATPTKLLSYCLSQPNVCTVVTGVSSSSELVTNLAYVNASNHEKDYQNIIESFEPTEGN